jgi:hypothetical protein
MLHATQTTSTGKSDRKQSGCRICAIDLPIHKSSLDAASKIEIEAVELFNNQRSKHATKILRRKGFVLNTLGFIIAESLDFPGLHIRTSPQVQT